MAKATQPPTEVLPVAKADDDDDDYQGIPRNTEMTQYICDMKICKEGYRVTQDLAFVIDAQIITRQHRQPLPAWLSDVVIDLLVEQRAKGHVINANNRAVNQLRWMAVRAAHYGKGLSWIKAYEAAAEALDGTEAAGEPRTMHASYVKVVHDLKAGLAGAYLWPPGFNNAHRR